MSMTINNQEDFQRVQRLVWGRFFGLLIQKGREKRGCSVEELAHLAGMEPAEWLDVEAGHVPQSADQLRVMGAVLQFSKMQLGTMVQLCRPGWDA
jgi:ribosome-binding protein aMBF1 (putative translation factor)